MTIQEVYDRFCNKRFPLPSEAQVAALEKRIGVEFPDDYRRYLLEFNGGWFSEPSIDPVGEGCPQGALRFMSGIDASHDQAELASPHKLSLFDDNTPPKILPIGGTPMGSLIILDTAPGDGRGEIYYKKAFGDFYWIADGIESFFALIRESD
jgi:cell wall assembly regulator SMI1